MSRKAADSKLFDMTPPKRRKTYGPVYKGVCRQINALEAAGHVDVREAAGSIAQARSIAESIDRYSTPVDPTDPADTPRASGMQLAALHERLESVLATLSPEQADADPFQEFLATLEDDPQEVAGRGTEAPHGP